MQVWRSCYHRWRFISGVVVPLAACDPSPPAIPPGEVDHVHAPVANNVTVDEPEPASAPPSRPASRPQLAITRTQVRRGPDTVEIEVTLDRPLPVLSSIQPTLHVGNEVAYRSRAGAHGRLDRLIFTVDVAQFDRMQRDTEIILRAGPFTNEAMPQKPRLSDVNPAELGGAQ